MMTIMQRRTPVNTCDRAPYLSLYRQGLMDKTKPARNSERADIKMEVVFVGLVIVRAQHSAKVV